MMFSFVTSEPTPTGKPITDTSPTSHPAAVSPQPKSDSHPTLPIPPDWLTCKISLSNTPSIKLFESLGFTRHKFSQVWQEVEMRYTNNNPALLKQCQESISQILFWAEE